MKMEIRNYLSVDPQTVLDKFEGKVIGGYNDFEIDIEELKGDRLNILLSALKEIFNYKEHVITREGNINENMVSIDLVLDDKVDINARNKFNEKIHVRVYRK